ncbi:MAG: sigma-70 family RNA polymerase sigma factor [Acidobacteriota bacterium]
MKRDDAALIERFLDGDHGAHDTVDGWILGAAYPFRRRLGDDAWEDSLQDLRLELTRLLKEGRFRGESSLRTYLSRIVCHYCLNRLRAGRRWRFTDLDAVEASPDPGPRIATGERTASRDLLARVLAAMSRDCRDLWAMVVQGWSYREMSRKVGVSEGALRVRVLRCRQKAIEYRAELEQEGQEPN